MSGIASGVGYASVNVITQQWLDKKRDLLNPLLLLGLPLFCMVITPVFTFLCEVYTWTGAVLVILGFLLHTIIVVLLFAEHPRLDAR